MIYHTDYKLSQMQFNIIQLKASILMSTFEGKLLKARRVNESSIFVLDNKLYHPMQPISLETSRNEL